MKEDYLKIFVLFAFVTVVGVQGYYMYSVDFTKHSINETQISKELGISIATRWLNI